MVACHRKVPPIENGDRDGSAARGGGGRKKDGEELRGRDGTLSSAGGAPTSFHSEGRWRAQEQMLRCAGRGREVQVS